jgi:hypothetical protein
MAVDTKKDLWKQILGEILVGFKVTHFVRMCNQTPFIDNFTKIYEQGFYSNFSLVRK